MRRSDLGLAGLGALAAALVAFHQTGRPGTALAAAALAGSVGATLLAAGGRVPVRELRRLLLFTAAGLLAVAAVAMAAVGARRADDRIAVVQLWLLPTGKGTLRVGVDTLHAQPAHYRLVLTGGVRRAWRVTIGGSAHWHATVALPRHAKVVARLYSGATQLRRVTFLATP